MRKVSTTTAILVALAALVAASAGAGAGAAVGDDTPPDTTITRFAPAEHSGMPFGGFGSFDGTTVDTETDLYRLTAVVANPLGQFKTYQIRKLDNGQWQQPAGGSFLVMQDTGTQWAWRWVWPSPDTHFTWPGLYTVSFLAADGVRDTTINDGNGNLEAGDEANTAQVNFTPGLP